MLVSIFTFCYNSTATLTRTYESLVNQTYKNIEWIVIDDLSTDDGKTRRLIEQLANEAPFPVKTHFLGENYVGTQSAVKAVGLAQGEYACLLDHDDQLLPDAVQNAYEYLRKYIGIEEIAGVCGRCMDENGNLIGKKFKVDEQVTTEGDIRFKQRITGELCNFTRMDVLGDAFIGMKRGHVAGYGWIRIGRTHNYVYVNDIFRIYDTAVPNSTSNTLGPDRRLDRNRFELSLMTLDAYSSYLFYDPIYAIRLSRTAIFYMLGIPTSLSATQIRSKAVRFFLLISYPLGFLKHINCVLRSKRLDDK